MTVPTAPAPPIGYCGRCGTAFGPAAGRFCRRCGNVIAAPTAVASAYAYPVVPAASVPAARPKLGSPRFLLLVSSALAVLVAAATAAAVLSRPSATYCQFSCGPELGPRLLNPTAYQNPEFGYRVEYQSHYFTLDHESPSGVELDANQANFMVFNAAPGGDVDSAIQSVVNGLSTSEYQDLHPVSSVVPGAEIGFVPGSGEAFTANFVAPGTGSSQPVSVVVMAATQANLTITVVVVGAQDLSNYAFIPFGLEYGQLFDFEPSNTIWPGGT